MTDVMIGSGPIPPEVVEEARREFGDDGLARLMLAIIAISCWNRVNVAAGVEPTDD